MSVPLISVAVITRNEADRIHRLFHGLDFADEILVVDSGSTDGTRDLCRTGGARVLERPWSGYAAQKQFALEQAAGEWVLHLDADEAVSSALGEEIREALAGVEEDVAGFSMPRLSRYLGRWIRHGGWYPDRKLRLVRRGQGRWEGGALHERLVVRGRVVRLREPILHYVYRSVSDQVATMDRFSEIAARERGPAGGMTVLAGVFHAAGKLAECYLWKLGILDGWAGLVIAMNSAGYVFLKHAKSWELSLENRSRAAGGDPPEAAMRSEGIEEP